MKIGIDLDDNIKVCSDEGSHGIAIKLGDKLTLFMPISKAHELEYKIGEFMEGSPVRSLRKGRGKIKL